jgi:hypothetical protein
VSSSISFPPFCTIYRPLIPLFLILLATPLRMLSHRHLSDSSSLFRRLFVVLTPLTLYTFNSVGNPPIGSLKTFPRERRHVFRLFVYQMNCLFPASAQGPSFVVIRRASSPRSFPVFPIYLGYGDGLGFPRIRICIDCNHLSIQHGFASLKPSPSVTCRGPG